jgi:hypothetical protein
MIDGETRVELSRRISERIAEDRGLLEELRGEVRPLRDKVKQIKPRSVTSLALTHSWFNLSASSIRATTRTLSMSLLPKRTLRS